MKVATANENFARELMELFTLGEGNYTEEDIKEAARAFTGWTDKGGKFRYDRGKHDPREKTVLGVTESRISQIRSQGVSHLRERLSHLREG